MIIGDHASRHAPVRPLQVTRETGSTRVTHAGLEWDAARSHDPMIRDSRLVRARVSLYAGVFLCPVTAIRITRGIELALIKVRPI